MLRNILLGTLAVLAGTAVVARAAAKDDAQSALKKLSDSSGYSWKATTEGGNGAGGGSEGQTQKDGLTHLTLKRGDNTVQVIFKGDKGAVKVGDEEWKSLSDTAPADAQQGPGRNVGRMVQNFKAPAAQAEALLDKVKDLHKSDDAYSGDLSEEGAKELMTVGRRRNANAGNDNSAPQVSNAKGSVKIWTKDGTASKIQYTLQGTVSRNGQDREVNRTTTVEINDVGNTKVEIPAGAKEKAQIPQTP